MQKPYTQGPKVGSPPAQAHELYSIGSPIDHPTPSKGRAKAGMMQDRSGHWRCHLPHHLSLGACPKAIPMAHPQHSFQAKR
mmetsp:Transcript_16061/g.25795  ORF Transcript_16061/g.25795 Transcript_16061/m.25795 type:complete len:81 (+) Transcript_16061:721-963(+)